MRTGVKQRSLLAGLAAMVVGALIVAGIYHWGVSGEDQNDDAAAKAVVTEYIDAINADDLSRLLAISTGTARLELETIDMPGDANKTGRWTEPHAKILRSYKNSYGDVKIKEYEVIARGDRRLVARVHTQFARQITGMVLPGENARFDLIHKDEGWRIESIGRYEAP